MRTGRIVDHVCMPPMQRVWYPCGDMSTEEVEAECKLATTSLIRWQFGRERVLRQLVDRGWPTAIVHVIVPPKVQTMQMIEREGEAVWTTQALVKSSQAVQRLIDELALPVLKIDRTP